MAIFLANKENTENPNGEYPFGNIIDDDGSGTIGTPVNVQVYGDFHQFFAKLMDAAGIAYNGVPDNAYDGFQYWEALNFFIEYTAQQTPTYAGIYIAHGTSPIKFRKSANKTVRIKGRINTNTSEGNPVVNSTIFTLPVGFRPLETQVFNAQDISTPFASIPLQITSAGVVSLRGDLVPFNDHSVYINCSFDID